MAPFSPKIIILFSCLWLSLLVSSSLAELQRFQQPAKADGSLSFLVVGDWGRKGTHNTTQVAFQMGVVAQKLDIDFIISTGDNFYEDGLSGEDDPQFEESFTNVFTAPSLQKQWYIVLGNHDYRGNVEAQLSSILTERDSRWFCMRSYILNSEWVDFIFVDTSPFVDRYFFVAENATYDWSGILPREQYLSTLLKDVDAALKESDATWKIVVGHHTIYGAGHHYITPELIKYLLPILRENKVDVYIDGHDHCLEHFTEKESDIHFLVSGAGSRAWIDDIHPWDEEDLKLYYDGQGFMSMQIDPKQAHFEFHDIFGNVLHAWNLTKGLRSAS